MFFFLLLCVIPLILYFNTQTFVIIINLKTCGKGKIQKHINDTQYMFAAYSKATSEWIFCFLKCSDIFGF